MGHHIDVNGNFKSDKYVWCPPGFLALKFTDSNARLSIRAYAALTDDKGLAEDLITVCDQLDKK